ncbi:SCO3242 family prenyltransferase [Actinacidiphila acidipaludis]|uniref:UbiA family prenyltransferase n=1 Tax=Actinacidiphila acidipaludis TaxID=2873382 RepID=A0ABS7QGT4_9ACTN|nr:UbiA family prenyltransferase [Streptomyces acidipaludis]MBY8882383.1 UbiA family prenyltransferase [Streptomyces acidipaludis]
MSTGSDWAELLRISALPTVPGDALAGAATTGHRPGARTALAAGASLCLYAAGMALNDWADRAEDGLARPHRPIPSGRISPGRALAAAAGLTAAGLGLAAATGRRSAWCATALAATVWAYDLRLKHTPAGPAAMAAARGLDLLLGATAATAAGAHAGEAGPGAAGRAGPGTAGLGRAVLPAAALAAHTYATTAVSRHETTGGAAGVPLAALGTTAALGALTATGPLTTRAVTGARRRGSGGGGAGPAGWVPAVLAGGYVATAARPLLHACLNPSPPLTQAAVGGQIRAMIPLQAALTARAGAAAPAGALAALLPLARAWARKVSPT